MLQKLQSSFASKLTMKLLAGTLLALLLVLAASLVACSSSPTPALTPVEKPVAIAQQQTVTTPSAFKVISLTISPPNVNRGEAVSITANVKNTSATEGSYRAGLAINKNPESSKTLTIPAGDTQAVSFTVSRTQAGTYEVSVGDVISIFTVVDQANLTPQQSSTSNTSSPTNGSSSSCCGSSSQASSSSSSNTPSSGSCCAPPAAPKVSAPIPLPPQTRSGGCCGK